MQSLTLFPSKKNEGKGPKALWDLQSQCLPPPGEWSTARTRQAEAGPDAEVCWPSYLNHSSNEHHRQLTSPLYWYQHHWHIWVFIKDWVGRTFWKISYWKHCLKEDCFNVLTSYYYNIISSYYKGINGQDSLNSNMLALGSSNLTNVLFGLTPGACLGTCTKQLVSLSEGDASPVSASKLSEASGQSIPDPASSWCLRKDPRGAGGGLPGREIWSRGPIGG